MAATVSTVIGLGSSSLSSPCRVSAPKPTSLNSGSPQNLFKLHYIWRTTRTIKTTSSCSFFFFSFFFSRFTWWNIRSWILILCYNLPTRTIFSSSSFYVIIFKKLFVLPCRDRVHLYTCICVYVYVCTHVRICVCAS